MFKQSGYTENMSMMMSQVLSDIGVNEKMVMKRRKVWLLNECMDTIGRQIYGSKLYVYHLGSQSEGATTRGIDSDVDQLYCLNFFNVIEDLNDWKPGTMNFLKIQEEGELQGYCKLQALQHDKPLPYQDVPSDHFIKDSTGKVLLKNTSVFKMVEKANFGEGSRHGPAFALEQEGFQDRDIVFALPLKSWPREAKPWLEKQCKWPTEDMRNYCRETVCFVVGVGKKDSENEECEWRVSTSLAERCLMFNLNITQIRCYVLMKFILKTFIKPSFGEIISSYMCKTILFYCIANTENKHSEVWSERNILICLSRMLLVLYICIHCEKCPHFISPENNMMKGKILAESKPDLLQTIQSIIKSNGSKLLHIGCDDFGLKLQILMSFSHYIPRLNEIISGYLIKTNARFIDDSLWLYLSQLSKSTHKKIIQSLLHCIYSLLNICCTAFEKKACCLLASKVCGTLGSAIASLNIQEQNYVSKEAFNWITLSLNTDVASSKLKLASLLYCTGEYRKAERVLRGIEEDYDLECVEEVCSCHYVIGQPPSIKFDHISYWQDEEKAIQSVVLFCVKYFQYEINCVPYELKYEMFRSTKKDKANRKPADFWMDSAVVDSLPYLYFLQYKVYQKQEKQEDKKRAHSNFIRTICKRPNLGHRETALNLLGQLKEEEGQLAAALHYYMQSLKLRKMHNVASIHICKLLSQLVNGK